MTINVSTPDGSNFSFPDGTSTDVIKGAIDRHFGKAARPTGGPWEDFQRKTVDRPPWEDYQRKPVPSADGWDQFPLASSHADSWDQFPLAKPSKEDDITSGMVLSGAPIIGAYVPKAEALLRAAAHPLIGVGEEGATFGERYAKAAA